MPSPPVLYRSDDDDGDEEEEEDEDNDDDDDDENENEDDNLSKIDNHSRVRICAVRGDLTFHRKRFLDSRGV